MHYAGQEYAKKRRSREATGRARSRYSWSTHANISSWFGSRGCGLHDQNIDDEVESSTRHHGHAADKEDCAAQMRTMS